ncbi:MAG: hypothetical protein H0V17_36385 [Deltaproteobacteria bacterium]|nr:hypothetical protein [Deltaproteobacteria bacterium]
MVAAAISFAATGPTPSARVARELGTLLLSRAVIDSPRWRAHANAQLVSTLAHFNLPLESIRAELREVGAVVCPPSLQPILIALLETELARAVPRAHVLTCVLDALWRPDWAGASIGAVTAALRAGAHAAICELPAMVPDAGLERRLSRFAVRGVLARHGEHGNWGGFEADVALRGAEGVFPISLPLVVAVADAIVARPDHARVEDLERMIARLAPHDRGPGGAHAARVLLHCVGERAAMIRVRAIRNDSVRATASYVLVRAALKPNDAQISIARRIASEMPAGRSRQRAELAIAQAVFRAGDPLRARRAIARVVDPVLLVDVWRLSMAIAMRLRPAREPTPLWPHGHIAHDEPAPSWCRDSTVSAELRARITLGVILLRTGLAGISVCLRVGAWKLRHAAGSAEVRTDLLELLDDVGLDPAVAIAALRQGAWLAERPDRLGDLVSAELLCRRARALETSGELLPAPYLDGALGNRSATTASPRPRRPRTRHEDDNVDAALVVELLAGPVTPAPEPACPPAVELRAAVAEGRSFDRALYDEGSTWGTPRRRGLIAAAASVLREAIAEPAAWDGELVACRARTLARLGGSLAREALEAALGNVASGASVVSDHGRVVFEALCWLDREAAGRLAIAHATSVGGMPLLELAERGRALVPGFTRAWTAVHTAIANRIGGGGARDWLGDLVAGHGVPSHELLGWVEQRAVEGELPAPRELLARAAERCEALQRVWPLEAARMVADDRALLDTLRLVRGGDSIARGKPWGQSEWTRILRRAASVETGVVDRAIVEQCARRLRGTRHVQSLLAGDLTVLGVDRERQVDRVRVRLLAKRGDLMSYLRFADVPIASCYRSDSPHYRETRDHLIAVWKDPLSLCFRIERLDGRPFGFVFGGFATLATGPIALVLNGMYLARQRLDTRTAVLEAIEDMVCRPLGIRHVGIANQFGGQGPLPFDYRHQTLTGTRLRALRKQGKLVTDAWDDISYEVNLPIGLDLWWRTL